MLTSYYLQEANVRLYKIFKLFYEKYLHKIF